MSDRVVADVWWDRLGWDLTEVILCKLPLRSMVRASAVCKAWRAVLFRLKQQQQKKKPWLFLRGQNNVVPSLGRSAFAYDPSDDGDAWVSYNLPPDCFAGAGGIAFAFDSASLKLAPLLRSSSHHYDSQIAMPGTPPLASSLRNCNPVVACSSDCRLLRLVVVGGARFAGGLVDMDEEEDPLPTELLEADDGGYYWRREQCAPLPPELSSSSELRSSSMVEGRFLFVCGAYSCTMVVFDLSRRAWTAPRQLRPATGLAAAFLASGPGGHRLVLAGLMEEAEVAFRLWDVDLGTLAPTRIIGDMPPDLLSSFGTAGSLRCVGEDGMLYVISDDRHNGYPACACDIILIGGEGEEQHLSCSSWRKLPPEIISRFHKMVAFTSPVLHHHLPNK